MNAGSQTAIIEVHTVTLKTFLKALRHEDVPDVARCRELAMLRRQYGISIFDLAAAFEDMEMSIYLLRNFESGVPFGGGVTRKRGREYFCQRTRRCRANEHAAWVRALGLLISEYRETLRRHRH